VSDVRRKRWIRVGPVGLGVSLPVSADRRLAGSAMVRRVIKPLLKRVQGMSRLPEAALPPDAYQPLPARRPEPSDLDSSSRALIDRVASITWYHSIDLGRGVVTPGFVDHRDQLPLYHLPDSLVGKRCLDVATWDGFWAFEMEKRGAAEVVAIDVARTSEIDMPVGYRQEMLRKGEDKVTGDGFRLAHEALNSRVTRKTISVNDLSPELLGEFDFIFVSDLLVHLRDPQLALDRVRSVCRGTLYLADVYHPDLETFGEMCLAEYPLWVPGGYIWWRMNVNTLKRMVQVAGFDTVDELSRFRLNALCSPSRDWPAKVVLRGTVGAPPHKRSLEAELLASR
jgi:tRNA (mo5U34)-methyltransferase